MIKKNVITPFEEIIKNTLYEEPSLILFELFPTLSHPSKSRFDAFFKKEKEVNNSKKNNKIRSSRFSHKSKENKMELNLKSIQNGMDKRTSLMIKNIPKEIDEINVINWLLHLTKLNYIYVPKDKISNKILGFAFINVCDYNNIIELQRKLYSLHQNKNLRKIEVIYSYKQGLESLSKCFGVSHIF